MIEPLQDAHTGIAVSLASARFNHPWPLENAGFWRLPAFVPPNSNGVKAPICCSRHQRSDCAYRNGYRATVLSSELQEVTFVRSDDLLKPDVMSEGILLGAGVFVFMILIVLLVVVLTQVPAPV
jgi:hypothetical protein